MFKLSKINYLILLAFLSSVFILVYIQYNSSKYINKLSASSERFVSEFQVSSELSDLEKDLVKVESKVNNYISTGNKVFINEVDTEFLKVQKDLFHIQSISIDTNTLRMVYELDTLVEQKLANCRLLLEVYERDGKSAAESLINTLEGKNLMDSIYQLAVDIQSNRHQVLDAVNQESIRNGKKAEQFNLILLIITLLGAAVLFLYIISIIQKLTLSEKKVKESSLIKEKFMANMSHEIRTPMNSILGFTNLLQRQPLNEKSKDYVQTIQKSGENLLAIINDILDLSKIEAGMMRIESVPFSMDGLIHSVETMFKSTAEEKGLVLHTEIDASIPETLEGDATRLTQILVNLIGNALKFTQSGRIDIVVRNKGVLNNIVQTEIIIRDTGVGIEKNKLASIFERFQQADDSITRHYGGTGLGLSIVKELIELQGGSINAESETGIGTSFTILLPYKLVGNFQSDKATVPTTPVASETKFADKRVLVAEDNEINQTLIQHLFGEWRLPYDLAQNGLVAIEKLKSNHYDLVLMDIQMPEMDGYTATLEIRKNLQLSVPIIAMTAHALAGEREKCISYGMNDYISKPIREQQLFDLINEYTSSAIVKEVDKLVLKHSHGFQYIDLHYMQEVSRGNKEYKKAVTEQFMEAIPGDLLAIHKAWEEKDILKLRQIAHNMKTSVSVMGLNEKLQGFLDSLEYDELSNESFHHQYNALSSVCRAALEEAELFYKTL